MTESGKPVHVVAALISHDGRYLVTRRPDGTHLAGLWEFPGGKIEADERPEEALVREIREELGIEVEVGSLRAEVTHAYALKTVHLRFFECRWVTGEASNRGVAEHRWVAPGSLSALDFPEADRALVEELVREAEGL